VTMYDPSPRGGMLLERGPARLDVGECSADKTRQDKTTQDRIGRGMDGAARPLPKRSTVHAYACLSQPVHGMPMLASSSQCT
jgi:hypothetical protein